MFVLNQSHGNEKCNDTYKGRPNRTMCESSVTRSKFQLPSKDTFIAKVSYPRSVKGRINFKEPCVTLSEESSTRDVNCDIFPVVDKKRENTGKRNKLQSTCLIALRFDQFPRLIIKVWASSKARMMTGVSLEAPFCFTWESSLLDFKNSTSTRQDAAGG